MKKFAMLAVLAAISGTAAAQSSVTLFGIVDEAARYVKNGDESMKSLVSGGMSTSRFGVRGTEDLGGGLKAGFWLESGFNADSGTNSVASQFWNRRSTVSLLGNFGEVRLGRDYTPTYNGYTDYDLFGDNGLGAASKFDISLGAARDTANGQYNVSGETRLSNQVQYFTPSNLGGFYGRVSVAPGEGVAGGKYAGGRVGYAVGALDVSASYGQFTVAPTATGDDKFKTVDVGGSYDFGVVKLVSYYTQSKFAAQKVATYSVGASVPVGLGQIRTAFTHVNQSGTANFASPASSTYLYQTVALGQNVNADDANELALGYVYNLSKRTALYSTAAYIKNKGNAQFAVATGPAMTPGATSKGVEFGIRHLF